MIAKSEAVWSRTLFIGNNKPYHIANKVQMKALENSKNN